MDAYSVPYPPNCLVTGMSRNPYRGSLKRKYQLTRELKFANRYIDDNPSLNNIKLSYLFDIICARELGFKDSTVPIVSALYSYFLYIVEKKLFAKFYDKRNNVSLPGVIF